MLLRRVQLDFSDAKIMFAEGQPEYCHVLNAISSMVHHLEAFLMKVALEHRAKLPDDADEKLKRDVNVFCQQEGWHSRLHTQFNKKLMDEGYPWMGPRAEKMNDDFHRFLDEKSPRFCLAYSEGFETFGPLVSQFFFEKAGDLMYDWDEPTVYLWLWHFAEEYEHRTVCNHLYEAVYGDYWPRIYGLWYATFHLFGYSVRSATTMINADLASGRITGGKLRSRIRYAKVLARLFGFILPRMVFRCMSPRYDPAGIPPPTNCLRFLDGVSAKYAVRKP